MGVCQSGQTKHKKKDEDEVKDKNKDKDENKDENKDEDKDKENFFIKGVIKAKKNKNKEDIFLK
jgi:hypothetical protein